MQMMHNPRRRLGLGGGAGFQLTSALELLISNYWGGSMIFMHSRSAQLLSIEIDCFNSL